MRVRGLLGFMTRDSYPSKITPNNNGAEEEELRNDAYKIRTALEMMQATSAAGLEMLDNPGAHDLRTTLEGICDAVQALRELLDKL